MRFPPASACLLTLVLAAIGRAEVRELVILKREPFAGGTPFGAVGPYEKITGIVRYRLDPNHARNRFILDLDRAPRSDGQVHFEADFCILAPQDPSKGNGALLYDVNNRGNKLALRFFNDGPGGNDPNSQADAGNGFLFRRGFTVVWCGWIGELLPGGGRMLLRPPVATENGRPIRGIVRFETGTDVPADSLPLSRREAHGSYMPTEKGEREGVLTWRMREKDPRVVIPREQWSLQKLPVESRDDGGVPGTLGQIRLKLAGGFRPGYIYELVCECEGPIVQGTGFAAVRDLISFLKYDTTRNPFLVGGKPAIQRAHGFGVSQSGRFLRTFLYLGANADEADRKAFDGLIPHVAGGGLGYFNYRFAQPTRHNGQHEDHSYPADVFPFTFGDDVDPFSKRTDGILRRLRADDGRFLPRVMHTQSAAEYWHRSGSLVHTDPVGRKDADIPAEVRIYAFGGTQHGPAVDPPGRGFADNLNNPGDYRPFLRGLLEALDEWVKTGTEPPASVYPRIADGTLVDWRQDKTGFPALPGIRYPDVIQQPSAWDFGLLWEKGILTVEPPRVRGEYVVRVPKSDSDGNDLGTLLPPEVLTPLATYTGWNLRHRDVGAEGQLANLLGSYIPFAGTRVERMAAGDPRLSVEERYGTFDNYRKQFAAGCADLVKRRYLLQEDADRLTASRDKLRDRFAR